MACQAGGFASVFGSGFGNNVGHVVAYGSFTEYQVGGYFCNGGVGFAGGEDFFFAFREGAGGLAERVHGQGWVNHAQSGFYFPEGVY